MSEKTRTGWKRPVGLLLALFCVGWLIYLGAIRVVIWRFAGEANQTHGTLDVVPTPLSDTSVAVLEGARVEKFGVSFESPWKDITRETNTEDIFDAAFREGPFLMLHDPRRAFDGIKILQGNTYRERQKAMDLFGPEALRSNYDLMATAAETKPTEVKRWDSFRHYTRINLLLMEKMMFLGPAKAIHPIHSETMRGFQLGDPDAAPYLVKLELFDAKDKKYEFILMGHGRQDPVASQAQINALIASIVPLASGSSMLPTQGLKVRAADSN